ncbi:GatB/YqeY domain-containing protein [Phaeovibrio sulfidiphilus]|uniref:GatB/YqeY domain-containing protein n=1 Tax=Phaeovibrio sulfidiphilus TaxID=1220600 RepID=A0A8J6YKY4_9PROT|nr:GatB/YqeY domain-containing protein [Phaeovibrio sulfidiphilus]MBE1236388.1 GatB/YqeY domain-containing protein [Phaeovibrio sulfidiphilus]
MLRETLKDAMNDAMRQKSQCALSTIRLILAAVKDRDIQARTDGRPDGITDEEILSLLQSMVKQRRDSITLYEQGGRLELAEQEQNEIRVIERFLPAQMSPAEVEAGISAVIDEIGATGLKDMGRVMASLKERFAGRMDFGKASGLVKARLS